MMTSKTDILRRIQEIGRQRVVSIEEVTEAYQAGLMQGAGGEGGRDAGLSKVFSYIGGAVAFLGISVLIWQRWEMMGDAAKILATLGSAVAAYVTGVLLSQDRRYEGASKAFYFLSALVSPLGLHVAFDVAGFDIGTTQLQTIISAILFLAYLIPYTLHHRVLSTFFSILFGTALFFSVTSHVVGGHPGIGWEFSAYRVLVVGLAYTLMGYSFAKTDRRSLTGPLYGWGAFLFLGAALALGDWKPDQNVAWEMVFPILTFGTLFAGIHFRSRAFLTFGSLYLMAFLSKITAEYFVDSLGWPLVLVLMGLGLIAVGYLYANLRRRYLETGSSAEDRGPAS